MDLLLELLDDAWLADSRGQAADFRNTIVVLTSALGSEPCWDGPPARADSGAFEAESESPDELRRELLEHFRPELLNRINRIVPFKTLALKDVHAIVDRIVERVRDERLRALGVELNLTPGAYEALVGQGFRPTCGVRDMERAVEQQIVEPLAHAVIEGRFKAGDTIDVVAGDDGLELVDSTGSGSDRIDPEP
jgi:ATP-dependent Clp protease ATP-binding subunit ClpA